MASPQIENGYTKIANEILENLAKIRIAGEAMQVFLVILRHTYGFNKKKDYISLTQFQEKTNLGRSAVCRAIKKLAEMNLVSLNKETSITSYEIVKNHEEWVVSKKTLGSLNIASSKIDNRLVSILRHTKETITKERNTYVRKRTSALKKKKDDNESWTRDQFVKSMKDSKQRHLEVLAEYAKTKKLNFITKGQWREFFTRNIKPASRLAKYTDEQISEAYNLLKKDLIHPDNKNPKAFITKWGIETLEKYLDK